MPITQMRKAASSKRCYTGGVDTVDIVGLRGFCVLVIRMCVGCMVAWRCGVQVERNAIRTNRSPAFYRSCEHGTALIPDSSPYDHPCVRLILFLVINVFLNVCATSAATASGGWGHRCRAAAGRMPELAAEA